MSKRRAQGTLEYVYLIGIAAVAVVAVLAYMSRGFQGNLRDQAQKLGAGYYDPRNTTANNTQIKRSKTTVVSTTTTTVTYGNGQAKSGAIKEKEAAREKLSDDLTALGKERDQLLRDGKYSELEAINKKIKETRDSLKKTDEELEAMRKEWDAREIIPDMTDSSGLNTETGTETVETAKDESLGSLSNDSWH